jgi:hypothetical protein
MTRQEFEKHAMDLLNDKDYKSVINVYKKQSRNNFQIYVEHVFYLLIQPLSKLEIGDANVSEINDWLEKPFDDEHTRRTALTLFLTAKL